MRCSTSCRTRWSREGRGSGESKNGGRAFGERKPVEGPWALPDGWSWERLESFVEVHDHLRRPINRSERNARLTNSNRKLYPYYGATGLVGQIDGYVADGEYVLLGEDGAPFFDKFRDKAYLVSGKFWVNNHAHVLRDRGNLGNRWILHWLNTFNYENSVNGTTRLKLTQAAMKMIPIPVPPRNLVPMIVHRIDELFTEIDDGEAALARARSDLGTWRKALLKAAVTGELTADWRAANPPTETGADLLARILADRRERWLAEPRNKGKRYVEPVAPSQDCLTTLFPGWAQATVEQVAFVENGQTPKGIEMIVSDVGEIPWFKVSSMNADGNSDKMIASNWRLDRKQAKKIGLRVHPAETIVFPKRGGSIFTEKKRRLGCSAAIDLNVMAVVPTEPVREYLWTFFQGVSLKAMSDGSNVPQINYDDVSTLVVPLPPPDEASEIAARVRKALHAMHLTEAELQEQAEASATLRQSILAAAFRGELVA